MRLRLIRGTQAKFTVSTAAIITNAARQVLLLNHVLRPYSGWGLPGGFVSRGEDPDVAIRREIREETGIDLDDLEMFRIRTIDRHVEVLYTAIAVGEPSIRSREILDLGWFDLETMPEDMSNAQKAVIRQVMNGG